MKNLKNTTDNASNSENETNNNVNVNVTDKISSIIFACDAGMGSSAMGASRFRERIKNLNLSISVTNTSVDNIPENAQIVVTHKNLVDRVMKKNGNVEIVPISNFLKDPLLDELYERIENQ